MRATTLVVIHYPGKRNPEEPYGPPVGQKAPVTLRAEVTLAQTRVIRLDGTAALASGVVQLPATVEITAECTLTVAERVYALARVDDDRDGYGRLVGRTAYLL